MRICVAILSYTALYWIPTCQANSFPQEKPFCWCPHHHAFVKPLWSPSSSDRSSPHTSCFQIFAQSIHGFLSEPFIQSNFFPLQLSAPISPAPVSIADSHHTLLAHQPSLTICPKRALQPSTTLPHLFSFPDTQLSWKHLLTHKPYPIHFLLAFLILFFPLVFSKSLYAF